ncbi:MAG: DUF2058 domain-containing protein [Cellvibrionaceae bacterium]
MASLQDQLLKAGLVNEKKAKQVSKEKRKATKIQHKSKDVSVDENKVAAAQAMQERAERDRQLNKEREAKAEQKAIRAQIKQLIEMNAQKKALGSDEDVSYNFTDGKKVKSIYVSPLIQEQLANGRLAIAKLGDRYEVVPSVVADKIKQRDESYILSQQAVSTDMDEDDPYADFQIPDDLMW